MNYTSSHQTAENDYPLLENHFYSKNEISKAFGVGISGGIRPNKRTNRVVVFFDAHPTRKDKDNGRNIYRDHYDEQEDLYYYTGQGQKGDQSISILGNKWLNNSRSNKKIQLFLFRQYVPDGKHKFIGQVEVVGQYNDIQKDVNGENRNVVMFVLRPLKKSTVSENYTNAENQEIYNEINSDLEGLDHSKIPTKEELEQKINLLNKKISEGLTKKTNEKIERTRLDYIRFKDIVIALKEYYHQDCQVCEIKHFATSNWVYSEVHHLTPWSRTHDDSRENLVVICANCHRKFHFARQEEKDAMYKKLLARFPEIKYKIPK